MYYLRTKSAVDAIKFTLNNTKAALTTESEATESTVKLESVDANSSTQSAGVNKSTSEVEPITPEELKQMLEQSKKSEDDDCLMCGS